MKKKFIFRLLPLIAVVVSLQSCRTNEDYLSGNEEPSYSKKFQVFIPPTETAKVDYPQGFAFLFKEYDRIHSTNFTGLKISEKRPLSPKDNIAEEHVDFTLSSQAMKLDNGETWVYFPVVENGKVKKIATGMLQNDETYVMLGKLDQGEEYNQMVLQKFQQAYLKKKLSASTNKGEEPICGLDGLPPCEIETIDIPPPSGPYHNTPYIGTNPNEGGGSGGGCIPYSNCGGGGGGAVTPPQDPCAKMKARNQNANFKAKVSGLDKDEMFTKDVETGFAAAYGTAPFQQMQNSPNGNVTLPDGNKYYGYIHTHINMEGVVKIFSPYDIVTFLTSCVANANATGNMADAYAMVITSQGNYILQYSGDSNFAITYRQLESWKTWYNDAFSSLTQNELSNPAIVEKIFAQFLEEKVNINGLEVYKSDKTTGNTSKLQYNGTDNPLIPIPCP